MRCVILSQRSDLRWGVINVMEFWSFCDSTRAAELRMSRSRLSCWLHDVRWGELQYSSLEWMREVAIVQAVLWSNVLRLRRRSRIWEKQDFEMYEIYMIRKRKITIKDNTKISSRRNRFCIVVFEEIVSVGLWILESFCRKSNEKKFSFSRVER